MKIGYLDLDKKEVIYKLNPNEELSKYICPIDNSPLIYSNSGAILRCPCCESSYGNSIKPHPADIRRIAVNQVNNWKNSINRHKDYLELIKGKQQKEERITQNLISKLEKLIELGSKLLPITYETRKDYE